MVNNKKNFIRNPKGLNQWNLRSVNEIQKIINSKPEYWTKKDFRGEGKNNKKKILTRKETERTNLIFGYSGNKNPLVEVYKYSTSDSILRFEKGIITEENFRNNAKSKKKRDEMLIHLKKKHYKERHLKLTENQLIKKRKRDKEYRESLKSN